MRVLIHAHKGIWLDGQAPLTAAQHDALVQAGLGVHAIRDWSEMPLLQPGQWLVARIPQVQDLPDLQHWVAQQHRQIPVICRVPRDQMALVVAAMRCGAWQVLPDDEMDPVVWRQALSPAQLLGPLNEHAQAAEPSAATPRATRSAVFVDPVSCHLLALAQRVGQANVTALLEGPTGAGKEVLARVLHESSPRAQGPFIGLNCAAMPEALIDDMLFGHEKGAFTGAQREHRGLFEQAQGGTLFLDEIGEMPLLLQAKLLRVLQERQLTRLGAERTLELDVRIVAATNRDLREAIAQKSFREDLYYRISTFKLRVPALRERPADILPLAVCMLRQHGLRGLSYSLTEDAQQALLSHDWPGNVRELENVVQRAIVLASDTRIGAEHLMFDVPQGVGAQGLDALTLADLTPPVMPLQMPGSTSHSPLPASVWQEQDLQATAARLSDAVRQSEQQWIQAALESTPSREEAARKLGISPRTLRYKLAKLKSNGQAALAN